MGVGRVFGVVMESNDVTHSTHQTMFKETL